MSEETSSRATSRTWSRQFTLLLQWGLPFMAFAVIPKCPACVATYVLLFTGIGLSFHTAAAVRWTLLLLPLVSLAMVSIHLINSRRRFPS